MFSEKGPNLLFGRISEDYPSLWAPLMEKAYSKIVGNYINVKDGAQC